MEQADKKLCEIMSKQLSTLEVKMETLQMSAGIELEDILRIFTALQEQLQQMEEEASVAPFAAAPCPPLLDGVERMEVDEALPVALVTPQLKEGILKTTERVTKFLKGFSMKHRDMHLDISAIGKTIDRNCETSICSFIDKHVFEDPENAQLLNKMIMKNYFRRGEMEVVAAFVKDWGITGDMVEFILTDERRYKAMVDIASEIVIHKMDNAMEWVANNRQVLESMHSQLDWKVTTLAFLSIIERGRSAQSECLAFARKHFTRHEPLHSVDISNMIGCLAFLHKDMATGPYRRFTDPAIWIECAELFKRVSCKVLNSYYGLPLARVVEAGLRAIPPLLNIQTRLANDWKLLNESESLPIELNVGQLYHSEFSCPILRVRTNDGNPPMRLPCGHVISREALNGLATRSGGAPIMCPYCAKPMDFANAKRIYF